MKKKSVKDSLFYFETYLKLGTEVEIEGEFEYETG